MRLDIPEVSIGNEKNLETLIKAAKDNVLSLVVCYDRDTKTYVDAVCVLLHDPDAPKDETVTMVPFTIFDKTQTLYERLIPCTQPEDIEGAIEAAQKAEVCSPAERNWIAAQRRINYLEAHLMALAKGVRSKRMLLASGSPSSKYVNVPDLLEAIAKEAECVINEG